MTSLRQSTSKNGKKPAPKSAGSKTTSSHSKTSAAAPVAKPATGEAHLERLVARQVDVNHVAILRTRVTPALVASLQAEIAADPGDEPKLEMAISTYVAESVSLACLIERHRKPLDGIGVSLEPFADRLGGDIGAQIVYLVDELRIADDKLSQSGKKPGSEPIDERGMKLLGELRGACELVVDDGVEDEKDVLVRGLRRKHVSRPRGQAALAAALSSYANAARGLSPQLATLPTFAMATIDEAEVLADLLLGKPSANNGDRTRSLRLHRNRILSALRARVRKARKVGRFAFRDYPEVLRQLASDASRDRRERAGEDPAEEGEIDEERTDEETPSEEGEDTTPTPSDDDASE